MNHNWILDEETGLDDPRIIDGTGVK